MPDTVLIVEDTDTAASTLEVALMSLDGVEVELVDRAERAWSIVEERDVAAIITDLHLPRMDGFELIERIRGAGRGLPIIVISGDSDPLTPDRVRKLGANAFFAKPYSPAAVRDELDRLLHETPTH